MKKNVKDVAFIISVVLNLLLIVNYFQTLPLLEAEKQLTYPRLHATVDCPDVGKDDLNTTIKITNLGKLDAEVNLQMWCEDSIICDNLRQSGVDIRKRPVTRQDPAITKLYNIGKETPLIYNLLVNVSQVSGKGSIHYIYWCHSSNCGSTREEKQLACVYNFNNGTFTKDVNSFCVA